MLKFKRKTIDGNIGIVRFGNRSVIAYCRPIAKYNMQNSNWQCADETNKKRALSIVKYNTKFGKKREKASINYDYYIVMSGMRVENYSKNGDRTGWGMNNFLQEIDKLDEKLKVICILIDNDAPLEKQAEFLSKYINKIKSNKKCKKIYLLGISKCGTVVVSMLKYLTDANIDKLNVLAYMAPYLGTIFASPSLFYKKLDAILDRINRGIDVKLNTGNVKELGLSLVDTLKEIHWNTFSKSHMDYDISEMSCNGVPLKHKNRYDKNFLSNMFDEVTLGKLKKVNFTNITTRCSEKTLSEAILEKNINKGMLYLSSKVVFNNEVSDGMVSLKSAKYIEQICNEKGIKIETKEVKDGHHDIASDKRIIADVIEITKKKTNYKK